METSFASWQIVNCEMKKASQSYLCQCCKLQCTYHNKIHTAELSYLSKDDKCICQTTSVAENIIYHYMHIYFSVNTTRKI